MRRIIGILAPLAFLVATAAPAWAHPGFEDPYVPSGRPTTLVLGVPSEEPAAMTGVDIFLPANFTLSRLDQTPGWQSTSAPGALHFSGGNAPQGTYVQFTFAGTFPKKAVLLLPVTTHAADGTTVNWNGKATDHFPAAYLFPGWPPGQAPIPGLTTSSTSTGRKLLITAGRIFVVAGAITLVTLAVVRRRRGAAGLRTATGRSVARQGAATKQPGRSADRPTGRPPPIR